MWFSVNKLSLNLSKTNYILFRNRSADTDLNICINLYINLKEGHVIAFVCPSRPAGVGYFVRLFVRAASFTYFGEVLRSPHKRIVTITRFNKI